MAKVEKAGFFASLFDFEFRHFITLRILKILYMLYTVLAIAGGAIYIIYIASRGSIDPIYIVLYVVGTLLAVLIFLIFMRVSFEFTAVFFRMNGSIDRILANQSKKIAISEEYEV